MAEETEKKNVKIELTQEESSTLWLALCAYKRQQEKRAAKKSKTFRGMVGDTVASKQVERVFDLLAIINHADVEATKKDATPTEYKRIIEKEGASPSSAKKSWVAEAMEEGASPSSDSWEAACGNVRKIVSSKEFGEGISQMLKEGQASQVKKQPDNCCICDERIVSEKRLYLNCNDVPGDPHCHSCEGGKGCLLAIGAGCAKKFKGKVKEVE